jgi:hypothetical protein
MRTALMAFAVLMITMTAMAATPPRQGASAGVRPQSNPIPDQFVNLKVLPKDISKPELVNLMKQFSVTFGVRCSFCHSVSDDLTQGRFDSDEKDTKVKARDLLRMIFQSKGAQ